MRRVGEQSVRLSDKAQAQVSPDAVQGKVIVRQGMGEGLEGCAFGKCECEGWMRGCVGRWYWDLMPGVVNVDTLYSLLVVCGI